MKGASPNVIIAACVAVVAIGAALVVGLSLTDSPSNDTTPLVGQVVTGALSMLLLLFNTLHTVQSHEQTKQVAEQVEQVKATAEHVEEIVNGTSAPQGRASFTAPPPRRPPSPPPGEHRV